MLEKEKTPHKLGGFVTLLCIRINLTCIKKLTKNKNYSIIFVGRKKFLTSLFSVFLTIKVIDFIYDLSHI